MRVFHFVLFGALVLFSAPANADQISPQMADRPGPTPESGLAGPATIRSLAEQTFSAEPPAKPDPASEKRSQVERIAAAQTKLAFELISHLSSEVTTNVIVSPASLASASALLVKGADDGMKSALAAALGFDETADPGKNRAALRQAREALRAEKSAILQSADLIVVDPESPLPRHLAARLKKTGARFMTEDLSKPAAVARVDAWVKETTDGAIPELIGAPLDKSAFAVLNALRFKAQWKEPFDPQRTTQAQFQSIDGASEPVALMRLAAGPRAYRADDKFIGIDLTFADERFSLTLVTTTEKPAAVTDFAAVKDWLAGSGFSERKGDLALPRFKLSSRTDLLPALDALGLAAARQTPTALRGFGQGAALTRIVQRTNFEIDEQGATAAAATAIIGRRAVDDTLHMIVDKPFIFALRDRTSGLVLVAGYIGRAPSD